MNKLNFIFNSDKLSYKFKVLNKLILLPIIAWPIVLYGGIFLFDNPKNIGLTFLIFILIILYPLYLILLMEFNARLHLKLKQVSYILPSIILLSIISLVVYILFSVSSVFFNVYKESKIRKEEGWFTHCETYKQTKESQVLYNDSLMLYVDTNSFKTLNCYYAKDKNNVYKGAKIIINAKPNSFELIRDEWQKDEDSYYYHGKKINIIDYESFKVLEVNYAKDNQNVYYYGEVIPEYDAKTFSINTFNHVAKDKNGCYRRLEPIDCDTKY